MHNALAWLYIERLMSLSRWTFPSTKPLLQGCCIAASSAASSRQTCLAKLASKLVLAPSRHLDQAAAPPCRIVRQNSCARETHVVISGNLRHSSSI